MKLLFACLLLWCAHHLVRESHAHLPDFSAFFGELTEEDKQELGLLNMPPMPPAPPESEDLDTTKINIINVNHTYEIIESPAPVYRVPAPPKPPSPVYRLDTLDAQCRLLNAHTLKAWWAFTGNATSPDLRVRAVWYADTGYGTMPAPQNVSTDFEQRYRLHTDQFHKYFTDIWFDVYPCKTCAAQSVKCHPQIEISWFPMWASISDIDRLLFEGRNCMAYWALLLKFVQWIFAASMFIQMYWSMAGTEHWPHGFFDNMH
ncbi:Ba189 [Baboon cytomegalovirus]|nr:Ba189 [Baboon cytomegalovirus]